jgi:hypothetical protein
MTELETKISLNLDGNFEQKAERYGRKFQKFGSRVQRQMQTLTRGTVSMSNGLDSLGDRYAALVTGIAGGLAIRKFGNLEERFTRIGIQAKVSTEKIDELKKEVYETANLPDIRVNPAQIVDAIDAIIEKTGDLKFAEDNIKNIGYIIQATGVHGAAAGELLAEFQKDGIKAPRKTIKALDTLNRQGKEGAFTLGNLAALGPRVITAYTAMGRSGLQAYREMGAALQVIRQGTGSSEMAATAWEAMLRTFSDKTKIDKLMGAGIQVFDIEALEEGKEKLRPINELMAEIVKKAEGKKTILSQIFDAEAIRAFNPIISEFNRTGEIKSFEKFMKIQGDGSALIADSARAAKDFNAALQSISTAFEKISNNTLAKPIHSISDAINSLEPARLDAIITRIGRLGLMFGGLVIANKAARSIAGLYGTVRNFRGRGNRGRGERPLAPTGDAMPVYVTNMTGSGLVGADSGKSGKKTGKKIAKRGGKFGKAMRIGGRLGGAATALYGAYDLHNTWTDENASKTDKIINTAGVAGGAAGGIIGTALGGPVGAAIGYAAGSFLSEKLAAWLTAKDMAGEKMLAAAEKMEKAAGQKSKLEIDMKGSAGVNMKPAANAEMTVNRGLLLAAQ